ncbi:aminodeoxychorismate lyase [Frigoribacterium sp. VKM Ac-1396]|uniref:aminodeoxychorismate lyase n=1 Tax=Frigoribacterium sp. VKM Ac-1396 TaxID=2783821 RepID=UPI00351C7380
MTDLAADASPTTDTAPPAPVLVVIDRARAGAVGEGPGWHVTDPTGPVVTAVDLGVTRGDGIFEAFGVVDGAVQALEPHLRRLARSAALLDLPELDLDVIREAVLASAAAHAPVPFALTKLIVTRGLEGVPDSEPTAWARTEVFEDHAAERRDGIRVVSLDRGYRHDVAQTSPWLLQGAKTLSYAVNKSVLREAARRGADDVLFVSSDGYALEGPSASLVARFGDRFVTPRTDQGILEGTTQEAVFDALTSLGHETAYELVPLERVREADALWLVSSGRQIAPVSTLDGQAVAIDHELTRSLVEALWARRD